MLFPTLTFAIFFLIVLAVSWRLNSRPRAWKLFMLAASYVFYGWWDWRFIFLLAATTVVNEVAAIGVFKASTDGRKKAWIALGVGFDLLILGFFKYYGFFISSAVNFLDAIGLPSNLPLLEVILPIGISFFTFQAISYVVDVYRKQVSPAPLLDIAVYLAFFPHLAAGPIVRASEFLPQLRKFRSPDKVDATRAIMLIGRGLFKKVVVATYLGVNLVDPVFGNPSDFTAIVVVMAVFAYAVQIYADFSGYTDIAIGCALLVGIKFPDNFNRPYTAVSIQDFWRRWHMTLSRWLRDYLYIPLGGNQRGRLAEYRNLFLTMLLGGLWHGASWTFVIWGMYHGVGLAGERWVRDVHERHQREPDRQPTSMERLALLYAGRHRSYTWTPDQGPNPLDPIIPRAHIWRRRIFTFLFVCGGWILFRSENMSTAWEIFTRIFTGWGGFGILTPMMAFVVFAALVFQYAPTRWGQRFETRLSRVAPVLQGALFGIWLWVIDISFDFLVGPHAVAPFIYFQF
ncbi:MAG: hypothetical protein JJLCMIEE_02171 [Acidimicrobiales bacterium]|nr:MAG: MBOAT family protein [Actinomycetota bacterium]MBV6509103.1 hypothetical protein [Acidimicrobiales bacterium]RIK03700.1 MAG: acyltransferase [Acidobacteriota bacterium]